MALTELQKQLSSILPHITGFMSWLGSLSIAIDVARKYIHHRRGDTNASKPTAYHRLILGMSLCDMCASGGFMMSTWPMPTSITDAWDTRGTDGTCTAQGFFIQLGIGVPFYNLCLAMYYYLVIVRNSQLSGWAETCMHFVSVGYAVSAAISALVMDLFGYATFWCWIKGEYSMFRWIFWYGPLWVIIVAISVIMSAIYYSLKKQEKRLGRHRRSYSSRRLERKSSKISDTVRWQAFWYLGSFFLTWIFLTIVRGMQAADRKNIPFLLVLLAVTLCPAQGFFNFLIYVRPRYKQYRKSHPEVGRFAAFVYVNPLYLASCKLSHSFAGRSLGQPSHTSKIVSRIARRFSKKTSAETLETSRVHDDAVLDYNSQEEEDCVPQEFEVNISVESRRVPLDRATKDSIEEALQHFGG